MVKELLKKIAFAWMLLTLCSCGGRAAVRGPEPTPEARAVVSTARSQLGKPYRYGGASPETGFDCSGLTGWVYAQHRVALPRQTQDQFNTGRKVEKEELRPGDLVFFETYSKGVSHVGIYIGKETFIHASHSGGSVRAEHLSLRYWERCYLGARRYLP